MSHLKLLPAEVQAATAESIPGLCTSSQACQSARQGVGRGRVLATGKGQPACPEAGSVQLSVSLTPTLSLPPQASHRAATQASTGPQGTTTLSPLQEERDSVARRASVHVFL